MADATSSVKRARREAERMRDSQKSVTSGSRELVSRHRRQQEEAEEEEEEQEEEREKKKTAKK